MTQPVINPLLSGCISHAQINGGSYAKHAARLNDRHYTHINTTASLISIASADPPAMSKVANNSMTLWFT